MRVAPSPWRVQSYRGVAAWSQEAAAAVGAARARLAHAGFGPVSMAAAGAAAGAAVGAAAASSYPRNRGLPLASPRPKAGTTPVRARMPPR